MPKPRVEMYKIGKVLGIGGTGNVNVAMHRLTKELVAIKSIKKERLRHGDNFLKLKQEVQIQRELIHDHLLKQLEVIKTETHYLIVTEFCPLGDLVDYIRQRKVLTESQAKQIFQQVMLGIDFMHSKGIVHLDIKLDNILMNSNGIVKIADFGQSRLL